MSYTPCSDLQAGGSLLLYRCRSIPDTLAMKHVLRNNQCGEIDACHTCHVGNYRRAGANLRVGGGTCCFIAVDPFPDHLRSSTHCAITGVGDVYMSSLPCCALQAVGDKLYSCMVRQTHNTLLYLWP